MKRFLLLAAMMLFQTLSYAQVPPPDQLPTGYCNTITPSILITEPYYAPANKGNIYTSRVRIGSIDNSSGFSGAYVDYKTITTDLEIGKEHQVIVNGVGGTVLVFLDRDRNGVFDDRERLFSGEVGSVAIGSPFTQPGKAILRIVTGSFYRNDGYRDIYAYCGATDGEVEDYVVNFVNPVKCITASELQITPSENLKLAPNTDISLSAVIPDGYQNASVKIDEWKNLCGEGSGQHQQVASVSNGATLNTGPITCRVNPGILFNYTLTSSNCPTITKSIYINPLVNCVTDFTATPGPQGISFPVNSLVTFDITVPVGYEYAKVYIQEYKDLNGTNSWQATTSVISNHQTYNIGDFQSPVNPNMFYNFIIDYGNVCPRLTKATWVGLVK